MSATVPLANPRRPWETQWTVQQVDQLRRLRDEGFTTSEVALRMGLTKGQIVGKLNRIGLAQKKEAAPGVLSRRRKVRPLR